MKRNGFFLFFLMVFILSSSLLMAQSNTVIDTLLNEKHADLERTAYMVLSAASLIDENTDVSGAFAALKKEQWPVFEKKKAEDTLSYSEYSFLLMKAFSIPGGVMYHVLPGPRYALRELEFMGFIDKGTNPSKKISGDGVVRILGYVLDWKEGQK